MTTALIVVVCVLLVALAWWRLAVAARRLDRIVDEESTAPTQDMPTPGLATTQPPDDER